MSDDPQPNPEELARPAGEEPTVELSKTPLPEPAPADPGDTPKGAVSLTVSIDQLLGLLAAVLVIFGSFGAWVDAGFISVSGIKGDGVITLIAASLALAPVALGRWRGGVLALALVAVLVAIYDIGRIASIGSDDDLLSISVGWGLVAVALGAVALGAWALAGLARKADKRPVAAASAIVLVLVAVMTTLAATGSFGEADEEVAAKPAVEEVEPNEPEPAADPPAAAESVVQTGETLQIGEQARLAGANDVEMVVTLERVVDPLSGGEFDEPSSGKRFVGVMIRLTNTGDAGYDDSPGNGAILTYGDDRQAPSSIVSGGACSGGFSSGAKISQGSKRKGCIVFEVPRANKIKAFQFTLDSGFAEQSAEWNVRPADGGGKRSPSTSAGSSGYTPPAGSGSAPESGGTRACDQNISAGSGTTCEFANDVFRSYAAQVQAGGGSDASVTAYSAAAGRSIDVYCAYSAGDVACTGGDGALVTFPKWAADVY